MLKLLKSKIIYNSINVMGNMLLFDKIINFRIMFYCFNMKLNIVFNILMLM